MIWKTVEERISQRLARPANASKDILGQTLAADEKSSSLRMTRDEMEINSMLFVIAGSESTTTVLLGIFNYLLRNPEKLAALTTEVRSSCKIEGAIDGVTLSKLSYLNAVFQEGLRLCPPFADGLRRQIPTGGAAVAGQFLPKGTVVSIPQWAAYQFKDNFSKPDFFLPERWLTDPSDSTSPYVRGQKRCIPSILSRCP